MHECSGWVLPSESVENWIDVEAAECTLRCQGAFLVANLKQVIRNVPSSDRDSMQRFPLKIGMIFRLI